MYKGTILQYLKKYIKDLQADQLESYILSGECTLHSFELEPNAISDWVSDIFPYTAEVEKVFCTKANIKIPWAQIRTKPLVITVQEMEMVVHVHDFRDEVWNMHMASLQKNNVTNNKVSDLQDIRNIPNFTKFLKQFELGWTDYVSGGMQIRVESCRIILKTKSQSRIPYSLPDSPEFAVPSYLLQIEGLFMAPCHDSDNGSMSYVDNPDRIYQYDESKGLLRLSRLITLKSFHISSFPEKKNFLTLSPGFRFRISSEYTCVKLGKHKYSVPPFASASDSEIWIDKLIMKSSEHFASFYAILRDLSAPVIVPPESLIKSNRFVHYTFCSEETIPKPATVLEPQFTHLPPPLDPQLETVPVVAAPVLPRQDQMSLKRLFHGLAKEVNKVTHRTDAMVVQGKKLFSAIARKKKSKAISLPDGSTASHLGQESPSSANDSPISAAVHLPDMGSPLSVADSAIAAPCVEQSPIDRSASSTGSFVDALETSDEVPYASVYQSEQEEVHVEGSLEGFDNKDLLSKLCFGSKFRFHMNEFFFSNENISFKSTQLDFNSTSDTPLAYSQLSVLAGFCSDPWEFVDKAKNLTSNIACPLDVVAARSGLSVGSVSFADETSTLMQCGEATLGWKAMTSFPLRSHRVQPVEGSVDNVVAISWEKLTEFCSTLAEASGSNPGSDLDPEVQLNLAFSNLQLMGPNGLKFQIPSGVVTRKFSSLVSPRTVLSSPEDRFIRVPLGEYRSLVGAKLETVEQEVVIESLRDQLRNLSEELVRKTAALNSEWVDEMIEGGESEILAEKISALELCLKQISDELNRVERAAEQLRITCADELVSLKSELLQESEKTALESSKLDKLNLENNQQMNEIQTLKRQCELLISLAWIAFWNFFFFQITCLNISDEYIFRIERNHIRIMIQNRKDKYKH